MNNEEYIETSNLLLNSSFQTSVIYRITANSIYGTVPTDGFLFGFVNENDTIVINTTISEFKKPKKFEPKNYF